MTEGADSARQADAPVAELYPERNRHGHFIYRSERLKIVTMRRVARSPALQELPQWLQEDAALNLPLTAFLKGSSGLGELGTAPCRGRLLGLICRWVLKRFDLRKVRLDTDDWASDDMTHERGGSDHTLYYGETVIWSGSCSWRNQETIDIEGHLSEDKRWLTTGRVWGGSRRGPVEKIDVAELSRLKLKLLD